MPEYDEKFLLDCSNFEKQRWKSYNFKFKLKPFDTNSNYLLSPVRYTPFKSVNGDVVVKEDSENSSNNAPHEYRHSFYGFPTSSSSNDDSKRKKLGNKILKGQFCLKLIQF